MIFVSRRRYYSFSINNAVISSETQFNDRKKSFHCVSLNVGIVVTIRLEYVK